MKAVQKQQEERYVDEIRSSLRKERIRYLQIGRFVEGQGSGIQIQFKDTVARDAGLAFLNRDQGLTQLLVNQGPTDLQLRVAIGEQELEDKRRAALKQNITTLRQRVDELGVAEPIIQQQGTNRIVVELPGIQDTARAKEILGATATLEFRLVDEDDDPQLAADSGRIPIGTRLYYHRDGGPLLLKRRVMLTGDYIIDAASGLDQQTGSPAVFVTLDGKGAKRFENATKDNIGKPMAVVFIENKTETRRIDGEPKRISRTVEEVISVATIRDRLGRNFQITGLDSTQEARDLALLLRAGALAAPISIVEERTVGPSAGQDNIDQGLRSAIVAFVMMLGFMIFYYRRFGLVANLALLVNMILIIAALSLFGATLTLPGIAGIILTIGMAVDANVLIFERIREELRVGNSPQAAIHTGFDRAFATILDANVTTLIAALVLLSFGTGPVRGFAVTLSIGIITSMFTAIVGTRAVINYSYGGRRLQDLPI